tara:strand:+ start:593 stop:1840 length:1248 start_codon:yes stop_codon:yes gene_type:complete
LEIYEKLLKDQELNLKKLLTIGSIMEDVPTAVIAIRNLNKTTGAARIALQQISILKNLGYHVTIICEKINKETIVPYGVDLKIIKKIPLSSYIRRLWFSKRANAWCQNNKPSLIISHGDMENANIIFMHNCVDLAQEIIYPKSTQQQKSVSKIHNKVLRKGSYQHVVANSQLMANDLTTRYDIPAQKISISYPGFDAHQFNAFKKSIFRQKKRDELGIKQEEKLIGLITSGDFKKRNLDFFIEISRDLVNTTNALYRFLVIGQGEIEAYKEKAVRLGVDQYFIWKKTVPEVEHYYAALDLFVLPAHIEEFGCVILEAMACSTLTLMSERVGAGELLKGELRNLIVKGYLSEQWAEKIESLMLKDNAFINNQLVETASHYTYEYQYQALQALISAHLNVNIKDDICSFHSEKSKNK